MPGDHFDPVHHHGRGLVRPLRESGAPQDDDRADGDVQALPRVPAGQVRGVVTDLPDSIEEP
jgi:hypothetical protein